MQRISMVNPGGRDEAGAVRTVFVRQDDDPEEVLKVSIVRPGFGVVKRLRIEVHAAGRKKQSGLLRPIERGIRKLAVREAEIATTYLARHDASNRRKTNGWVKDLPRNISRSMRSDD
ncbi:hypothetical protein [Methylobacterium aquaticum]|nr:hypothetical protein [Methylobacterium aquaticum]